MSTRSCIIMLAGDDESEGEWTFDLHSDFQRPDVLDVFARTEAARNASEFSMNREQVQTLRDTLDRWLES